MTETLNQEIIRQLSLIIEYRKVLASAIADASGRSSHWRKTADELLNKLALTKADLE